jgi:hypothetical protein
MLMLMMMMMVVVVMTMNSGDKNMIRTILDNNTLDDNYYDCCN